MSVITSLTGLQVLTNLQNLNADWNNLQSVDISNLPALTTVDLSDQGVTSPPVYLTELIMTGSTAIQTLRLDDNDFSAGIPDLTALSNLELLDLDECGITGSLDLSFLPSLEDLDVNGNEALTELTLSSSQPINDIDASSCALTEASVDAILVALSLNGISNGYLDLGDGTNAIPGATGQSAITVLAGLGWSINVNV